MKIVRLKSESVKRLVAVEITPEGNLVIIGGENGAGKSSVLDSILYAISGGRALPEVPVRKGEERALIELDLGDLKVRRTFTATGGTSLTVMNKEGAKYNSPQAMLDALTGRLGFDPLEFSRQKPADQYETLRTLAGLDFAAIDKKREEAYTTRTIVGREITSLEGQLNGCQHFPDAPEQEISTEAVMQQWREASATNDRNKDARLLLESLRNQRTNKQVALDSEVSNAEEIKRQIAQLTARLERVNTKITEAKAGIEAASSEITQKEAEIVQLRDIDISQFQSKIHQAETINRQVRINKQRETLVQSLSAKRKQSDDLTQAIESSDIEKRRMIAKAKLPIEGLSFEAGRVLFDGIPFSQMSTAAQIKISVAVGIALNPKLKVLLIREGSLLDLKNLGLIKDLAKQADYQIWCEVTRTDGDVSVVIEDGLVKGAPRPETSVQPELVPEEPAAAKAPEGLSLETAQTALNYPTAKPRGRKAKTQPSDPNDIIP